MRPRPLLKRVPRDALPEDMQSAWDSSREITGDATPVEVCGNKLEAFDWYLNDVYGKLCGSDRLDRHVLELVRLAKVHGCALGPRDLESKSTCPGR